MTRTKFPSKSNDVAQEADRQIDEQQRIVEYQIREYPIDVILSKFRDEDGRAELFIPAYQRAFVWQKSQQSRFIESVLIGLPIPYIFAADSTEPGYDGCLEIIDGTQRIRTLEAFCGNKLKLTKLEKLEKLNGFRFEDLTPARQRRFLRTTLRLIELTNKADEETRLDMFDRLNTGGTKLTPMEILRGAERCPLLELVTELSNAPLFQRLCPLAENRRKRFEGEELALRFLAYSNSYESFVHRVDEFLKDFVTSTENNTEAALERYAAQFTNMLAFVERNFPQGFKKAENNNSVPRIRFEAIAVGTALALARQPTLRPGPVGDWLESTAFQFLTRSDASNNRDRVIGRFEFVRDMLLGHNLNDVTARLTVFRNMNVEEPEA